MTTRPAGKAAAAALTVLAATAQADTGTEVVLPQVVVTATRSAIDSSRTRLPRPRWSRATPWTCATSFASATRWGRSPGSTCAAAPSAKPSLPPVGAITLRGIPRTPRTLVLLDGQPLNNALSGGVNLAGIAMHEIDRVEVVRGPFSALYGGHAMGGVIQLLTAAPTRREVFALAGAGDGELPRQGYAVAYKDRADNGLGWSFAAGYRASDGWEGSDLVVKTPVGGTGAIPVAGAESTPRPPMRGPHT